MQAKYLEDCYAKEFESEVIEVKNKFIVLKETLFYPNSGGQPNDEGTLNEFKVVFVGKFKNQISHEIEKEGLKVGDKVKGVLDWDRRYQLMQSHTAAHIVSNVIHAETGALITGNQLGLDKIRVDFSLEEFNREKFDEYMKQANEIVKQEKNVSSMIVSKDEATKILGERFSMLAKGLPESIKEIRVIEIDGFAKEACGGTHVKNTKEVGEITLLKVENKGKNNRRVYFKLGI
jgi:misacylated tRNA(Ala) deacylase